MLIIFPRFREHRSPLRHGMETLDPGHVVDLYVLCGVGIDAVQLVYQGVNDRVKILKSAVVALTKSVFSIKL